MQDQPSALELIEAVRSFLEERALPELEGRTGFHARVAVNALAIVQRELERAPAANRAERGRLEGLLGAFVAARGDASESEGSENDDLLRLNRELCRRIRAGEIHVDTPGLTEHLWETTLAKLAIDQPKYEAYRRIERR